VEGLLQFHPVGAQLHLEVGADAGVLAVGQGQAGTAVDVDLVLVITPRLLRTACSKSLASSNRSE
jgi:hypothetical protein